MNAQSLDAQEFDDLYITYSDVVFRNILKFTKEPVAAKDILQDVFVKLWEKKDEIKKDNSVSGLLFVISYHLCMNYTRKKMREEALHQLLSNSWQYSSDGYSMVAVDEEQERRLEKALLKLSPQKRRTVTLCKLQGKTYVEAAQELHISPHTVKEYLSNAIVLLNDYMKSSSI